MVTDGELVLADGSGMPTLLLRSYTCQSCVESYLSQILVFLELLLLGAPILWFPVLEPRSRKTNRHALCGISHPGSSGAEPLEKKNACSSCSPQHAAFTPYLCRVHLSWDFTVFMAMVSSWHWDLTVLVLLLYTDRFWISSILKEHIPRRIMIYLTIRVTRPVSCDEWIRAI